MLSVSSAMEWKAYGQAAVHAWTPSRAWYCLILARRASLLGLKLQSPLTCSPRLADTFACSDEGSVGITLGSLSASKPSRELGRCWGSSSAAVAIAGKESDGAGLRRPEWLLASVERRKNAATTGLPRSGEA